MTEYSEPRYAATKYTVYPRGFDQSPYTDSDHFCVYVEQFPDTKRWYVHAGDRYIRSTHKGTWVWESNLTKRWTRFDTLEQALEVALVAVDTRRGRTLVELLEWEKEKEKV